MEIATKEEPSVLDIQSDGQSMQSTARGAPPIARTTVVKDVSLTRTNEAGDGVQTYSRSETFGRLAMALSQAQGEFQEIDKTLTATVTSRREGARSYTYNYADLATVLTAVRPALAKHGLAISQFPEVKKGALRVTTLLMHGESEQWLAGDIWVALDSGDAQTVGSALTYARRYGAMALLGIAAGETDDDGKQASTKPTGQPDAPKDPDGFDDWYADIEACADNGTQRLTEAWSKSSEAFRTHLKNSRPGAVKKLKERAAAADKRTGGAS